MLFIRTTDLVQRLQVARRELGLEAAITKLDKYQLLILDDIAYITKDQAETRVLFELIATRYERRSLLITANQPFGEWGKIFADQAMTLAAIDRLVHHATILEMNVAIAGKWRSNASVAQTIDGDTAQPSPWDMQGLTATTTVAPHDGCQGSDFTSLSVNRGHRAVRKDIVAETDWTYPAA